MGSITSPGSHEHVEPANGISSNGVLDPRMDFVQSVQQWNRDLHINHRRRGELKEVEVNTLDLLWKHGPMIVGDIQRVLGVLPAQMSRVIRSLEVREHPLIQCRINDKDKRKVDVEITPKGREALLRNFEKKSGKLDNDDTEDKLAETMVIIGQILPPEKLEQVMATLGSLTEQHRRKIAGTLQK